MPARRLARALRRAALLLPLALLAGALVLLGFSPDAPSPPVRAPLQQSTPAARMDDPEDLQSLQENPSAPEDEATTASVAQRPWFMRGGERRPRYTPELTPLFPEDDPESDRIVEQLMYTLPEEEADAAPLKQILLVHGLRAWDKEEGRAEFVRNRCPVDRCTLTADAKAAATADAVLFKDHVDARTLGVKRPMKQIWMLYYLECPYHTAALNPDFVDLFNWTANYRTNADIVAPYEKWVYYDPARRENRLERNFAANKTKKVAWLVSNCHARNNRLQYAKQLSKYIEVDIYGACGSHRCHRQDTRCVEMMGREYKFYLAFENSNCREYVTEKLFVNGLGRNMLPIVMGAHPSEYARAAPYKSYIHVDEFAGPEELASYLHLLDANDDLYNAYFRWKDTGEFINTFFFCRVCAMLHATERRQRVSHYTDVQAWWKNDVCTSREWRKYDKGETRNSAVNNVESPKI